MAGSLIRGRAGGPYVLAGHRIDGDIGVPRSNGISIANRAVRAV